MRVMELLPIIFLTFLVSILFSMLGLGGAIIYTPLFFWLGIPLLTAIPMALFLNMITTASSSITYMKQNLVDKRIALPMIMTSIIGALTGSYLAQRIETGLIIILLSIMLLIAAFRMLFYNNIGFNFKPTGDKRILFCGGFAFIIGMLSSLAGIGGGTFIVPFLLILELETKNAVATSASIITFTSLAGFAGYLGFGTQTLDSGILLYAGLSAFAGAQIGSKIIFRRISSRAINDIFAVVLLLVAGKLLYGLL